MNLHVPQSMETRAELENIHMTPRQIITPQDCSQNIEITILVASSLACGDVTRMFTPPIPSSSQICSLALDLF